MQRKDYFLFLFVGNSVSTTGSASTTIELLKETTDGATDAQSTTAGHPGGSSVTVDDSGEPSQTFVNAGTQSTVTITSINTTGSVSTTIELLKETTDGATDAQSTTAGHPGGSTVTVDDSGEPSQTFVNAGTQSTVTITSINTVTLNSGNTTEGTASQAVQMEQTTVGLCFKFRSIYLQNKSFSIFFLSFNFIVRMSFYTSACAIRLIFNNKIFNFTYVGWVRIPLLTPCHMTTRHDNNVLTCQVYY